MFGDYFKYMSAASQKKRAQEFERKIFPLGLSQRELALKALRPLINPKLPDTDILFSFISAKEKYMDYAQEGAYYFLKKQNHLSAAEKWYIMALVLLDINVKSLEEYPCTSDIEQKAESLVCQTSQSLQ